jgi:hypothetical protein
MAHQRPATGLAAGEPAQPALERGELAVERPDQRKRDLDPWPRRAAQRPARNARPSALSSLSGAPATP